MHSGQIEEKLSSSTEKEYLSYAKQFLKDRINLERAEKKYLPPSLQISKTSPEGFETIPTEKILMSPEENFLAGYILANADPLNKDDFERCFCLHIEVYNYYLDLYRKPSSRQYDCLRMMRPHLELALLVHPLTDLATEKNKIKNCLCWVYASLAKEGTSSVQMEYLRRLELIKKELGLSANTTDAGINEKNKPTPQTESNPTEKPDTQPSINNNEPTRSCTTT